MTFFRSATASSSSSTTSSPFSSFFSDELPTPRSSTESRVSEALLLHIPHDDELLELQSCIKPEPMSQTRLPYSTSPSIDIQSLSGQHEYVVEDAVEIVKVGLKRLHPGDVQVCKPSICPRGRRSYTSTGVLWNQDGGIQQTVRVAGGGQT